MAVVWQTERIKRQHNNYINMTTDLSKYSTQELLLIYFNQNRRRILPFSMMSSSNVSYDDSSSYYNYGNYDNYDNYGNYNDYSNYDQYNDNGGCFITTAVCSTLGKPDDCYELMTFRRFRDTYMRQDSLLSKDVDWYYRVAPRICMAIDSSGLEPAKQEYKRIWDLYLTKAIREIENRHFHRAYEIYKDMVLSLQRVFLPDTL